MTGVIVVANSVILPFPWDQHQQSTLYLGFVMFCLPLISALLEPYVDTRALGLLANLRRLQLLGGLMVIASFFALGGAFWDKNRVQFFRDSRLVPSSVE